MHDAEYRHVVIYLGQLCNSKSTHFVSGEYLKLNVRSVQAAAMSDDPSVYLRAAKTTDTMEQSRMFDSKKWLWLPDDEEGFKTATLKSQKGDKCVLELSDGAVSDNFSTLIFVNDVFVFNHIPFGSHCRRLRLI